MFSVDPGFDPAGIAYVWASLPRTDFEAPRGGRGCHGGNRATAPVRPWPQGSAHKRPCSPLSEEGTCPPCGSPARHPSPTRSCSIPT